MNPLSIPFLRFFYVPVLIPLLLTYYVLYLSEDTKASDVFFRLHIHVIPSLQNEQRARVYRPFVFGRRKKKDKKKKRAMWTTCDPKPVAEERL